MRSLTGGCLHALVLSLPLTLSLACQSGSLTTPDPALVPAAQLGTVLQEGAIATAALGFYALDIDPASLEATATLKAQRSGAANDDLYLLPIGNFLRPDSLSVTGISSTASTLELSWTFQHPFPAPENPEGAPNGFSNRADLSIAGMLLFLTDVPTPTGNTWFTDRVANTSLITNPDAYWDPAGLLNAGLTANTFPYQAIVDERGPDGSRIGITHGGDPTGNFGTDGWTRGELGFDQNGWTGYGVLHGGQASAGTLSLSRAALAAAGSFSLDVAVIAKYNDPRGGVTAAEKRANRLPPGFPDASLFAYRMPHGALDVARLSFAGSSEPYITGTLSASTLSFHVEDWDARAVETTVGDLSGDFDVTTVAVGEAGVPTLAVSIPGVIGDATVVTDLASGVIDDDSGFGGDVAQDSGRPGDALFYSDAINSAVSGPAISGSYTGLVRATDVEIANIADPNFIVELDGTLTPLSGNIPVPVTYQSFTVTAQTPVSSSGFTKTFGGPNFDEGHAVAVDASGNIFVGGRFTGSINFGGGVRTATGSGDYTPFILKLDGAGDYVWDRVFGGSPDSGYLEFVQDLTIDAMGNVLATGQTRGTPDFGGGPSPGSGFNDIFIAKYDTNNVFQWVKHFGPPSSSNSASGYSITSDPSGDVYAGGQFSTQITPTGGSTLFPNGTYDGWVAKYTSAGTFSWSKVIGGVESGNIDAVEGVFYGPSGALFVTGKVTNSVDFGAGPVAGDLSSDAFVASYTPAGALNWARRITTSTVATSLEWGTDVAATNTHVVVCGFMGGTSLPDFGGGARASNGGTDSWIAQYTTATGAWVWDRVLGGTSSDWVRNLAIDPADGSVILGMRHSTTVDFGGGPRTVVGSSDVRVVRLNSAGNWIWDSGWGGTSTDDCWGIAVDAAGNAYATGFFNGTNVDLDPGPGVSPVSTAGSSDIYLAKLRKADGLW